MPDSSFLSGHVPIDEFLRAFPFFFAWDESDRIVEIGPSLAKICPQAQPGAPLQDVFALTRPAGVFGTEHAFKNRDGLFVFEDRSNRRVLRGSLLSLPERKIAIMLATPWITDPGQLMEFGLTLSDFGAQDQTLDLLHLLQTQHMAAADLRRLNQTLTEQRALLREQEAHSRKLALVAAHTDNAVIVTDAQGRIEWSNEAFTRISGWALDEARGKKPGELVQGPETDPATIRYMSECLRAKRGFSAELLNYHRDGRQYWVAIEAQPLLDAAGEVMNFMAIERDITERKQHQQALDRYQLDLEELVASRTDELLRNKLLLEAIVKTTPNGLLLVDHRGAICMSNAALDEMFGYAPHELFGRPLEILVPEEKRGWRDAFAQGQSGRFVGASNLVGQRQDGSRFPIDVALATFTVNGEHFIQATIADITTRKQAEDALRDLNANLERKVEQRTMELAAASAAKSEFLANMSHEIRTPMNGILGLAQLLERETLPADQHDMVARIRQAGHSLLNIINDVLDFSKIEAGQLRIDPRPFQLAPMLAQIGSLLGASARGKGLELKIDYPPETRGVLVGDFLRLEQVLMNLVGNAIKFTQEGEIVLRVRSVEETASALRLRFEVRDTGIGISREQIAGLFTPFTQADAAITRRFGGTGLGLSISKRLVELMGGGIGVDSVPGVGSTFWFETPFERGQDERGETDAQRLKPARAGAGKPRLTGVHCLVVDDSRMNRDVIERLLTREGARATLAADGQQAVQYLRAHRDVFDAVLMDIQMPVMDGLAATRAIRNELCLRDMPVIALTAGVLAEQRRQAEDVGCNDFVPKPVDLEELVAVVQRWTARAPATAPLAVEDLGQQWPDIPGLDAEHAIMALGGDRDLFLRLVANFVEEFGDADAKVRQLLDSGETQPAAKALHALAGAAGYIGANNLIEAARALEHGILAQNPDLSAVRHGFETEFARLHAGVELIPQTT